MKTILVPIEYDAEQNAPMISALDAALLLAQKVRKLHRGLCARPAVADMVAMDPGRRFDHGRGQGERRGNGAAGRKPVPLIHGKSTACRARRGRSSDGLAILDVAPGAPSGHDFVGSYGRVFDVIVLARPGEEWQSPSMVTLESALFESGRPVLIAPPASPRRSAPHV
jgi:hypothetical protein